jgi:hypothetical protein
MLKNPQYSPFMKKLIPFLAICILFTACKSKRHLPASPADAFSVATINTYHIPALIQLDYQVSAQSDPVAPISSGWFELYEKNGDYFLAKANYRISEKTDDYGGSLKTLSGTYNTLIFIDKPGLREGKIGHITEFQQNIWPNDTIRFSFNGRQYHLRAEGRIHHTWTSNDTTQNHLLSIWHNVSDYKLFYGKETETEELILVEPAFDDSFVKLLFVGDIDRDERPDFIFEAPRNYDETRILLFLSDADDGKILYKASEIVISSIDES